MKGERREREGEGKEGYHHIMHTPSSDSSHTSKPLVPQFCALSDLRLNTQLLANLFNFLQQDIVVKDTVVLPYMGNRKLHLKICTSRKESVCISLAGASTIS